MTSSTKPRKATTTYRTEAGRLLEAVRLNPGHRSLHGRRYAVLVDGHRVGTIIQTGRGRYTFPAMQGRDYLAPGLSEGLLVSAAHVMAQAAGIVARGEYV